jgi:hypothetical protein
VYVDGIKIHITQRTIAATVPPPFPMYPIPKKVAMTLCSFIINQRKLLKMLVLYKWLLAL